MEHEDKKESVRGVFSTQEVRKVGTGTTTKKSIQKVFWYCAEIESGENTGKMEVQNLNSNYVPSGSKRIIEMENFLQSFAPEPEFYMGTVFPRMREMNKTIARGERHRSNQEYYSAEMEFNNALKVDEENVRANFGLGLTYMQRGENAKAEDILSRIVKLDAAFEQEHKHLFNEFGIQLRKNKMYGNAIAYYARALELSKHDENIYHNIARACLEHNQPDKAVDYLLEGLKLNQSMGENMRFLLWMLSKGLVPETKKAAVAGALKRGQPENFAPPADA